MTIRTSVHDARQMSIKREGTLPNHPTMAITTVQIVDADGMRFTLTLTHQAGDLPITISES